MDKYISYTIVLLTFSLFLIAIFVKGLTHDLLLEAGVFLVSAKIIIANYHMGKNQKEIVKRFNELSCKLDRTFILLSHVENKVDA